ncbi:MAG: hypothetical protein JWL82_119 [Parcubacteria group bacterium]|nr:hypothetical protein [Parcubacteria group bacterium]
MYHRGPGSVPSIEEKRNIEKTRRTKHALSGSYAGQELEQSMRPLPGKVHSEKWQRRPGEKPGKKPAEKKVAIVARMRAGTKDGGKFAVKPDHLLKYKRKKK